MKLHEFLAHFFKSHNNFKTATRNKHTERLIKINHVEDYNESYQSRREKQIQDISIWRIALTTLPL